MLIMSVPSKHVDRYLTTIYPFITFTSSVTIYYLLKTFTTKVRFLSIAIIIIYYLITYYSYYPNVSGYYSEFIGGQKGLYKIMRVKNRGEYYLDVIKYLNKKDGKQAYNEVLRIYDGEKLRSTPGFLGLVVHYDSATKNFIKYRASEYDAIHLIPDNCSKIKAFGPRWPFKFEHIVLYECEK